MNNVAQPQITHKPTTFAAAGVRGAPLEEMTTAPEPLGAINVDAVKIDGHHLDRGAFHRAVAVARELCAAGLWDGTQTITIFDPYVTHNKVFGVAPELLKSGIDYLIVAPVIPNTQTAKYQIEEDGNVLWVV